MFNKGDLIVPKETLVRSNWKDVKNLGLCVVFKDVELQHCNDIMEVMILRGEIYGDDDGITYVEGDIVALGAYGLRKVGFIEGDIIIYKIWW